MAACELIMHYESNKVNIPINAYNSNVGGQIFNLFIIKALLIAPI